MTTIGPFNLTTFSDDAAVGTQPWSNPSNALASDNAKATALLNDNSVSHYLKGLQVAGLPAIADAATVSVIKIKIERLTDTFTNATDTEVKLVVGGTVQADNQASGVGWPNSDTVREYTFAVSLTGAQIKAATFGVVLSAVGGTFGLPRVDHIFVSEITYTDPPAGSSDHSSLHLALGLWL